MSTLQVIIPVFNGEQFLAETIESVLKQQQQDMELVILDNASVDGTRSIAEGYRSLGIRYIRNPNNIGGIANHNLALQIATANYVKLLSADDILLPGVLARQREALDRYPDVGLVTCNCVVTDDVLRPLRETNYLPGYLKGSDAIAAAANKVANIIGAPSNVMVRRRCIGSATYDKSLKWLADLDFACQVLSRSDFFNIDMPGFLYRRHEASDTVLSCPPRVRLHDELAFTRKYGGGLAARARIFYRFARRGELKPLLLAQISGN